MAKLKILKKEQNLKKAWAHEALEFTPWLSEDENLSELGDTVGIDLQLKETESSVDEFRADIICTEGETDRIVVIENQLEETNHNHLGQIITYAAGKDAKTVIWIARKARDAHAKAVQWLNEHTDIDFFLVEIELWAINEDTYAPHFNVVERPIDWGRKKPYQELSQTGQILTSFWEHFNRLAPTLPSFIEGRFNTRKAWERSWYDLRIGRNDVHITLAARTSKEVLSTGIYIRNNDELYRRFEAQKTMIESALGTTDILWHEGRQDRTIRIFTPFDIQEQDDWDKAVVWLCDNALRMRNIVEKIC